MKVFVANRSDTFASVFYDNKMLVYICILVSDSVEKVSRSHGRLIWIRSSRHIWR